MKKNVHKIVASFLSASIFISLAACGNGGTAETGTDRDSTSTNGNETGNEQTENTDDSVEVLNWFSDVSGWGPATANWSVSDSPATAFIRDEFGLTLNIEQPPTDPATTIGLMIATDDLPDLISISNQDTYRQLIEGNKVWELDDFFSEHDAESHLLTDFPADIKGALVDTYGAWYSYPSHMESVDNRANFPPNDQIWIDVVEKGDNSAIMFNKDIMDELGITAEDVSTVEGFLAACELVKNSGYMVDGQEVLVVILQADNWINGSLDSIIMRNFGVVPVDENGDYRHYELSPGYKNALQFVNTLVQNDYLDVNTMTLDEAALRTYQDAKRVFAWFGNQAQHDKTNMPWVSYGPILAENGARPVLPKNMSAGMGWIQTLVSLKAENSDRVAKLLSWASSREGLLVNYYGHENVDYTLDENGVFSWTDEGATRYAENYDNNMLMWPFANTSFERNTEPVPDPTSNRGVEVQIMPAFGNYEDTYIYDSSLLEFTRSTVIEPSSDLGIKLSQIENYLESQKAKIITAESDAMFETEYNDMIDSLLSYDIELIDNEYNEIFQQYKENIGNTIEDVNAGLYN